MTPDKQDSPLPHRRAPVRAIPFVNREGHVMRLSGKMTLGELLKLGVVEIHLAKKVGRADAKIGSAERLNASAAPSNS